jgi:hypothetical protein
MSLTIAETTTTYTPPPAGSFPARLLKVVDLGLQDTEYEGEHRTVKQVQLVFQLLGEETRDDGTPFELGRKFTASMGPKAALRKMLEAWRCKPFTVDELRGFNVGSIVGLPCMVSVAHKFTAKGDTYAVVGSVSRPPKGLAVPELQGHTVVFDMGRPETWPNLELLPQRTRELIEASQSWREVQLQQPTTGFDDMDDDLPY